jgi:hypothetical protein
MSLQEELYLTKDMSFSEVTPGMMVTKFKMKWGHAWSSFVWKPGTAGLVVTSGHILSWQQSGVAWLQVIVPLPEGRPEWGEVGY